MNQFIQDRKCLAIHQYYFLNQLVKDLPQIPGLRIWGSPGKFDHEMNLKNCI